LTALITGDSHCNAYADVGAQASRDVEFDVRLIGTSDAFHRPFHDDLGTCVAFRHEVFYLEEFARRLPQLPLARRGQPFDWYGFSGPLHLSDLWLDRALFAERRQAVSKAMLRQVVLDRSRAWLAFLGDMVRLRLRTFVIEAPGLFAESAVVGLITRHVDPQPMLGVDRFARSIVKQQLAELGVAVVEVPPGAFTADGFMAPVFRHCEPTDPHHGNRAFGAMMLEQAAKLIGAAASRPAPPFPAHLLEQLVPDQGTPDWPVVRFADAAARPGRWVVQPGTYPAGQLDRPVWLSTESAGTVAGLAGLRFDGSWPRTEPWGKLRGLTIELPGLAPLLSEKKITVAVLARSADAARETRFAVTLNIPGPASTGWRWFSVGRDVLGQSFDYDVPVVGDDGEVFLGLIPNDGSDQTIAPAEIFAVAIEIDDGSPRERSF
jgi:hypothetical protein